MQRDDMPQPMIVRLAVDLRVRIQHISGGRPAAGSQSALAAAPLSQHNAPYGGDSVAEWLACWTQAQKGLGSNRSRDAVG